MNKKSIFCFLKLIYHEIYLLKAEWFSRILDLIVITFTSAVVFGWFFPQMGSQPNYGAFIIVGIVVITGFFNIMNNVVTMLFDLTGDRVISYNLLLPLPSSLVFSAIALGWGISAMIINILIFPLGKLFLMSKLTLSNFSFFHFLLMYITIYIFFGYFALWLSSIIKSIRRVSMIWFRIVNPLFMFGGFYYTWKTAYNTSHLLGDLHFINPLIYAMEGLRAAALGQEGFLPYWLCFFALWGFIVFFALFSNYILRRRLDCI